MESTDQHILALLAQDGRMSYTDIGRETGLSTSAAQQRVRRLEQRGAIRGYHADIDPAEVGLLMTAFIALRPFDPAAPDDVPDRLLDMPEVISCYSVAGDASYLIKVLVESPHALELLLAQIRSKASCSTLTTLVLSTPFVGRPIVEIPGDPDDAVSSE